MLGFGAVGVDLVGFGGWGLMGFGAVGVDLVGFFSFFFVGDIFWFFLAVMLQQIGVCSDTKTDAGQPEQY